MKKRTDPDLKALCDQKENCRRRILLRALGSDECSSVTRNLCCDCCQPVYPYFDLTVPSVTLETRKRRPRTGSVPVDIQTFLETKLLVERDAIIAKNPALKMLPKSVVCPLTIIRDMCARSHSINSVEDISAYPCIRPELHLPFFHVFVECLSCAPPSKRTRTLVRT